MQPSQLLCVPMHTLASQMIMTWVVTVTVHRPCARP